MKNIVYIIFMGIIAGFSSCKSQTDIYEEYVVPNGLIYPGQALNPVAKPGDRRIEISWNRGTDPRVEKARIYWNNYTDSVEFAVAADADIVSRIIEPIAENTYSFIIRTYDGEGNASIPVEVLGTVYGEGYRGRLTNRPLKSAFYDGLDLALSWGAANGTETGVRLNWTDIRGERQTGMIDPSETETTLPDFDYSEPLSYSTAYLPDSMAIDLFYATPDTTVIDPVVLIPKSTWTANMLNGDMGLNSDYPLLRFWDGNTTNFMHSENPVTLPCTFTWDLGIQAKLSRMKLWPRNHNDDRWNKGHPRIFEIYGSLEEPSDGPLDPNDPGNWTLLGKFTCVQPSGNGIASPWAAPTTEDIALSDRGLDFEFVPGEGVDPSVTVRYIRFRSIEHFHSTDSENPAAALPRILLAEISFWGTLVRER
ncbi:MAG: hypothetical protein LBL04_11170 [Bacteroidales bacterium]|jgi:hypothetical protein|nr:hypothetical protein [Bacteroidales bacterium]